MDESGVLSRTVRRDGVVVDGPDAASWLQGQVSQDVEALAPGQGAHSLVLSPQGKVESFCRVTRLGEDRFVLDVEAGFGEGLLQRLARFKLRVKVTLEPVAVTCEEREGAGFDSLGSPEIAAQSETEAAPSNPADEARFEAARILAGVPRLGHELTERTIPQEAGDELVRRSVSFTKGCYTGQELVARLDSRGSNVPRRVRLLRCDEPTAPVPEPGDVVQVGSSEAGAITSAAPLADGGWVALALIKRSALAVGGDEVVVLHGSSEQKAAMSGFAGAGE